jgi:hypothetical protein
MLAFGTNLWVSHRYQLIDVRYLIMLSTVILHHRAGKISYTDFTDGYIHIHKKDPVCTCAVGSESKDGWTSEFAWLSFDHVAVRSRFVPFFVRVIPDRGLCGINGQFSLCLYQPWHYEPNRLLHKRLAYWEGLCQIFWECGPYRTRSGVFACWLGSRPGLTRLRSLRLSRPAWSAQAKQKASRNG